MIYQDVRKPLLAYSHFERQVWGMRFAQVKEEPKAQRWAGDTEQNAYPAPVAGE